MNPRPSPKLHHDTRTQRQRPPGVSRLTRAASFLETDAAAGTPGNQKTICLEPVTAEAAGASAWLPADNSEGAPSAPGLCPAQASTSCGFVASVAASSIGDQFGFWPLLRPGTPRHHGTVTCPPMCMHARTHRHTRMHAHTKARICTGSPTSTQARALKENTHMRTLSLNTHAHARTHMHTHSHTHGHICAHAHTRTGVAACHRREESKQAEQRRPKEKKKGLTRRC